MGQGITIECKSCDYIETFILGMGMMYSSLENVISLVSPKRQEAVLNILQYEDVHEVTYAHKLFVCPQCNTLAGRFDFSISYKISAIVMVDMPNSEGAYGLIFSINLLSPRIQ